MWNLSSGFRAQQNQLPDKRPTERRWHFFDSNTHSTQPPYNRRSGDLCVRLNLPRPNSIFGPAINSHIIWLAERAVARLNCHPSWNLAKLDSGEEFMSLLRQPLLSHTSSSEANTSFVPRNDRYSISRSFISGVATTVGAIFQHPCD